MAPRVASAVVATLTVLLLRTTRPNSVWSMTMKTFPVAEWSVAVSPGRDKVGTRASWLSSEKVAPCLASAVLVT